MYINNYFYDHNLIFDAVNAAPNNVEFLTLPKLPQTMFELLVLIRSNKIWKRLAFLLVSARQSIIPKSSRHDPDLESTAADLHAWMPLEAAPAPLQRHDEAREWAMGKDMRCEP